ncbi:MAG: HNH endonuclease [Saprospiraceae bacterium]
MIHQDDTFFSCQIDHIISIKHGGDNDKDNLAYSCIYCNRNKGSDIGSVLLPNRTLIRFYKN